jgi:DNA-binding CsgD family transcriptional regulator
MRRYESLLDVIDLAYQAALEPGLWPNVLVAATASLEASRALILYGPNAMFSSQADEPIADRYFAEFKPINPLQQALDKRGKARPPAYSDQELVAKAELVRSDFYNGFLSPADMHSIVMMPLGTAYSATVNVFRGRRAESFERHEIELAARMQRSLSRAWTIGERLGARRAVDQALADLIDRLPSAVLLVNAAGRIVHANAAGRTILASPDGLAAPAGILEAAALPARAQLRQLMARAAHDDAEQRTGAAMSVPRPSGRRPFAMLVAPARGEPAMAYREPLALVCVSDPAADPRLAVERLRGAFGFTPAEARVAAEFAAGHDPQTIADRLGLSLSTVRVQILRIRAKTDTRRHGEFVALVLRFLGADWSERP